MLPNSLLPTLLPKPQFRAVISCGFGVDLFPLVEPTTSLDSQDDEPTSSTSKPTHRAGQGQTKALLPVAGKKMIDWVLERVEQAGIFDILVLTPQSIAKPMGHHLRARRSNTPSSSSSSSSSSPSAKIELEEIPEDVASRGCVRVLIWAAEKNLITTDFILLPCDLLLSPSSPSSTSISLASLLDRHRTDDNLLTTLFSTRSSGNVQESRKDGPVDILTVWDKQSERLLDVKEMDEFDEDEIPLRTSLLNAYPSPTLTTQLLPTQLYIFSSLLLPLLTTSDPSLSRRLKSFESLRELAGWLARSNWRKGGESLFPMKGEEGLAMGRSTTQLPTYHSAVLNGGEDGEGRSEPQTPGIMTPALVSRNSWLSRRNSANPGQNVGGKKEGERNSRAGAGGCKVVVWDEKDGFCARGNTVNGWVEINRAALKLLPPQPAPTSTPSGVFISPDSFLNPTVYPNLGEKVGIKRCIIGKGTIVGKGSKLTNSVIMENVVIGENVKLDNCVISNGVQVRDRAQLKDCEFGRDVIIDFDSQLKGEQLTVGDE